MGTWCALWRISVYGHLLYFCSTGVPVTWMLSSNGTEATIRYFLNFVKSQSPEITPQITMSNRDQAQMNAIKAIYLDTTLFLCWWHVLRAMQMHFCTEEFPELWEHVREWVKTSDQARFDSVWEWIQTDPAVPKSFVVISRTIGWALFPSGQGSQGKIGRSFKKVTQICSLKRK